MNAPVGRVRPPTGPRTVRRVDSSNSRLKIVVRGAVQGVGFRPFIYRLATARKLNGWVSNCTQGVFVEVEGPADVLEEFLLRVRTDKPPRAVIQSLESSLLDPIGFSTFEVKESDSAGDKSALILPDIGTCADCLREIFDPSNPRFRYPFTNCTNCGPRFSIIEALPYDRVNTSMKKFAMCSDCEREYHDPFDRRFHAQPNACPRCGPHLQLWDEHGRIISERDSALYKAADAVRAGKIVALKGIGGFQLILDACNGPAVVRLRQRKHREEKPFALMYASLDAVRDDCEVSEPEERLLLSPESPIVLLTQRSANRKKESVIASAVAPRNPKLGVMLPYSPLHHLLMRELEFPLVATSGNLSDEPICTDEREALERLRGIANLFLVHDRPIVRHVDDSIVHVICGREMILRRARGYAPLPITLHSENRRSKAETILAVGAHLKNTVALKIDDNVFVSQHIGDLETKQAYGAFCRATADLPRLYDSKVDVVACDMHPEYLSTKHATQIQSRIHSVQHHWAHVIACMAENEIEPPVLGVAWDGTGYGLDGTIWGGEFLRAKSDYTFERVAHLRQFRLPGGDAAIREPRRVAIGLLQELFGDDCWNLPHAVVDLAEQERALLRQILERKINAPLTSSVGRLFDAVAALIGLRLRSSFEAQAAMELEFARDPNLRDTYSLSLNDRSPIVLDWEPMIRELLNDLTNAVTPGLISAKLHNGLVEAIVAVAKRIGEEKLILTGGCFQNRYLTERTVERLREERFRPYWHQRIPPNDGGISLGQTIAAMNRRD
ncbi:MAG TPA: carbamoyltransferase HypF [Chthoniobacterales bacterium]|nr:carbamoyltransferase HypF [Chthoniobacterales bacterium]